MEALTQLRLVVAGTPDDEQTIDNGLVVLRALTSIAELLRETQLSSDEITEVGSTHPHILVCSPQLSHHLLPDVD